MGIGIHIHSVDNNATVPWEWHVFQTASSAVNLAAGYIFRLGEKGMGKGAGSVGEGNGYYLSVAPVKLDSDEEAYIPLIPIRDDMVLEAYALITEDFPAKLGDRAYAMEFLDTEGRDGIILTAAEGGNEIRFEIVGIITDCEPEYTNTNTNGMGEALFMPLTTKILVRLVK